MAEELREHVGRVVALRAAAWADWVAERTRGGDPTVDERWRSPGLGEDTRLRLASLGAAVSSDWSTLGADAYAAGADGAVAAAGRRVS